METVSRPTLIAFMGLPRSGKSTLSNKLAKDLGAPIVRRDAIRLVLTGHRYMEEAEPMVKTMSLYMIRALFESGHETVICDETNYSRAARNALLDDGWNTVFYPVLTPPEVCIERAYLTHQPDLVPVIRSMWARYEPLGPDEEVYNPS